MVKVVTKAGAVDMEATNVVGTTTIEVAADSEVVGIRESPWSMRPRESSLSTRP